MEMPSADVGAEIVDAADGVDGLFDALGDLGFDFFRRGATERRGDGDDREDRSSGKRSTPSFR